MLIQQDEQEFTVPIEDIAIIVVESRETVITAPLLSALALNGVTLLTCDEQFIPCGQWLPFNQYHRQLKTLRLQLDATLPQKKQLWQAIVQQKIRNQAYVLQAVGLGKEFTKLTTLANNLKSGDKDNAEAQAAVIYFPALFGKGFKRTDEESEINAHLNYAYTVLRSAVARAIVLYGWLPQLGLFHHSELNAFNLVDDFIEPFRPLVDYFVWHKWENNLLQGRLELQTKQQLIKLLHYEMRINGENLTVLSAIDRCVGSLQTAMLAKDAKLLKLPEMLPLKEHQYE